VATTPDISGKGLLLDYVSQAELAEQLGITVRTLARWRARREGPPPTFFTRKPVYRIEGVRAWLKSRERPMIRERKGRGR
jgi:transcriptional regulator with XRE-family HTH domain